MKYKLVCILLLISTLGYSQVSRFDKRPSSTYKPLSMEELMYAPNKLQQQYNQNQQYLLALEKWVLELIPQIQVQSFIDRLNDQFKQLEYLEDKDLARASTILQQREKDISKIISDYKLYVAEYNRKLEEQKRQQTINKEQQKQNTPQPGSPEYYYTLAYQNHQNENYAGAVRNYSKYLEKDKNNTDVIFFRAMAKSELNDKYGAIRDYDKVIELHSDYPLEYNSIAMVYNNKAYTLTTLDKLDEALKLVNTALEMDNETWEFWDTRGEIYYKLGNYEKCISDCSKAIAIDENANSFYIRGLAYYKIGEKELSSSDLSRAGELGATNAYEKINELFN